MSSYNISYDLLVEKYCRLLEEYNKLKNIVAEKTTN
jgi:hypothetical protein